MLKSCGGDGSLSLKRAINGGSRGNRLLASTSGGHARVNELVWPKYAFKSVERNEVSKILSYSNNQVGIHRYTKVYFSASARREAPRMKYT